MNTETGEFRVLLEFAGKSDDGETPNGSLTLGGAKLYGWTYAGGSNGNGVLFSYQIPQADPAMTLLLLLD
jgi:hypothetical protein